MTEKELVIWKEGYEKGMKAAMRQNDAEINLGHAVLKILDERYELRKEEYE